MFCFLEGQFADTLQLAERAEALLAGQASPQGDTLKFIALLLRCPSALIPVLLHQGQVNEAVRCFERTRRKLSQLSPGRDQEAMVAYLDGLLALECNQLQKALARLRQGDPSALIAWTADAENQLASASDNRGRAAARARSLGLLE